MKLTVKSLRATERNIRLRLPFSYGDIRVEEMPEAQLELAAETADGVFRGQSAQMMAPRWFNKAPDLTPAASIQELRQSVKYAVECACGLSGSVAAIAHQLRAEIVPLQVSAGTPLLAAGYGVAVVEAALIDAVCRAAGLAFPAAVKADIFGLSEAAPADLGRDSMLDYLRNIAPRWSIGVRHTVGYHSPLLDSDASALDPGDGLPYSLDGAIAQTGCSWFKIKLKGNVEDDLEWLAAVDAVIAARVPRYRSTVDANEQYAPDALGEFVKRLETEPAYGRLRNAIAFIEQPFPREIALSESCKVPPTQFPLVIDESDDCDGALLQAFERGWSGTSAKSCKGVLHALTNAARVAQRRSRGEGVIMTAEDLSCQVYLALQQDTLMAMAVGATHVERNGHQFGGPLQGYDSETSAVILDKHGDLYRDVGARPYLRVQNGEMQFASLNVTGFGSVGTIENIGLPLAAAER